MITISKKKYSQGERIARIVHFLATEGSKSFPELRQRFSMFSEATIPRDMTLLKKTRLVVERKEARFADGKFSRKIFVFFKDDKDIISATKRAMENLRTEFRQVPLDHIASCSGHPPDQALQNAAYMLAPKVDLLIGKEEIIEPPDPLVIGPQEKKKVVLDRKLKQHASEQKRKTVSQEGLREKT